MYLTKSHILAIDLESLGQFDSATVLSIGLCCVPYNIEDFSFENLYSKSVEIKLNATEQVKKYNRTIDKSVLDWWKSQSEEAQAILKPSHADISISDLPVFIEEYLNSVDAGWKCVDIWDRKKFDLWKLQHIYQVSLGREKVPWSYVRDFDFVTIMEWLGGDRYYNIHPDDIPSMVYHSAKSDAALDVHRLLKLFHDTNFFE